MDYYIFFLTSRITACKVSKSSLSIGELKWWKSGAERCRVATEGKQQQASEFKTWLVLSQQIYQDWGKIFLERKTIITWWIWNIWLVRSLRIRTTKTWCLEKEIPKSWTASYLGDHTSVSAPVKAPASVRVCPDSCYTEWLSPVTWWHNRL